MSDEESGVYMRRRSSIGQNLSSSKIINSVDFFKAAQIWAKMSFFQDKNGNSG